MKRRSRASSGGASGKGRTGRRRRRILLLLLLLLLAAAPIACLVKLDREIVHRFEGKRWRLPSKIYSDAFSLYPGISIEGSNLYGRLRRLGYQATQDDSPAKGEYRKRRGALEIHLHDFVSPEGTVEGFPVRLVIREGRIDRLVDLRNGGEEIYSVDLEPELITGLFEQTWEERRLIKLAEVPRSLIDAIVAVEDQRFFRHIGIDPGAIARAALANLRAGRIVQGASTLTQQLVKNFFLTPRRTFSRKVQEALMALILEVRYTKDQILEAYLNEIYFGQKGSQGIYGVGEASEFYFGKPVGDLDLPECALLAGLIRSPNLYAPHKDTARIRARRDHVLARMKAMGTISDEAYQEALGAEIVVRSFQPERNDAPFFVDYLVQELKKDYSLDILTSEGLLIFTTLDVEMQSRARKSVQEGLKSLEARHASLRGNGSAESSEPLQACLVALEPQTGYIRAMIGGRDYGTSQFNRTVQARRQPGSLFKPVTFVTALERGGAPGKAFTPASLLRDEPIDVVYDGKTWSPRNFNDEYYGEVTMRTALERSLNCATVWLSQQIGLGPIRETAERLGMPVPADPLPSLVLGACEAVPLEVAAAFGAFANHGVVSRSRAIKKVLDKDGAILERKPMELEQAISPESAYLMTYMLKGVFERGTARSAHGKLPVPAAGKTGTSNDYRDAWFAGYTPHLVSLVWVGFDRPRNMHLAGSQAALPIWVDFMRGVSGWVPANDFVPPPGIVFRKIDRISGLLATPACQDTLEEAFREGTEPTTYCDRHAGEAGQRRPDEKPGRGIFRRFFNLFR